MNRVKVIQIGIGHDHATAILDSLLKQRDIFEVAALAVPENEKSDFADKIKKYGEKVPVMTVERAFEIADIDAVVVETEEENLTEYAYMAVDRGLPVHMDKPGGLNPDKFERLINLAKKNKTVFHIGYMYRYNKSITKSIRRAKSGELGEIYCVEAHMSCWHRPKKRQWLSHFPGGMTFYLGCHLIDIILQIMGNPKEIIPMNMSTGIDEITAEDYCFVIFKYKNGVSFAKTSAAELGGFERRQLVICGSKGTIELRPLEEYNDDGNICTGVKITEFEKGRDWNYSAPVTKSNAADRYDEMMLSFAKMVCGEKTNLYDCDYELNLYKTLLRSCGVNIV